MSNVIRDWSGLIIISIIMLGVFASNITFEIIFGGFLFMFILISIWTGIKILKVIRKEMKKERYNYE